MCSSAVLALAFGLASALPFAALLILGIVYSSFVTADSASLTAGAVAAARPGQTGATVYDAERPGPVEIVCHLPGHEAYGMVGTVEVVARPDAVG